MPTILSLAGVPVPDTCAGQNISKVLKGGTVDVRESQYIMHIANAKTREAGPNYAPFFRGVYTKQFTYAITADGDLFDKIS